MNRKTEIRTGTVTVDSASTNPVTVEFSPVMANTDYKVFMTTQGANGAYIFAISTTAVDTTHFSFVYKNVGNGGSAQRTIAYLIVG